jgi:glycerol-3-phosphate O-acyltransferase
MNYLSKLESYSKTNKLPKELSEVLHQFYFTYTSAAKDNNSPPEVFESILVKFLDQVYAQINEPYTFEPFHQSITAPFNHYQFGLDFIRPIVISKKSKILHPKNIERIDQQISQGDNVILLANHQTELDPQAISLLLEEKYPKLAESMIFVAGHRVTSDPMAVPFSKGCNLLCINSKKYIEDNPALKPEKLLHNQRTMMRMSQLLSEGGKCIYVAPSGGRDRRNREGKIEVAHFDPQSIEMFWLMSQRAEHPTHFYPFALSTYHLLPPPDHVKKNLGEHRHTQATPVHIAFGNEIDMEKFPGCDHLDKKHKRTVRAHYIWEQVKKDYDLMEEKNHS